MDKENQGVVEIEVTPEMVRAGLDALSECSVLDDWAYTLETIYRAMAYESLEASSIKSCE